ncbi:hypothetical protein NKR19_g5753 [Coniochaeta hoffmannii]|uniref:Cell wall mannoprotein PIR1-like C-terminal domain-containing protein n=1 Tax=Coniochaeta hoffmannii TaxID=91930 RepID=A0AA38VKH6_9PEZI|nr:hypothetical protein NKR19_g5753 [Coniochaeta hoffmannii]
MKATAFAFLSVVGSAAAQAVTAQISPTSPPPPGCTGNFDGNFEIQVRNPLAKRDRPVQKNDKRQNQCSSEGTLVAALSNGVLKDAKQRTGYIASNYQFQFDGPPQAGAIYTAGFSICVNDTLALGGSTQWWGCASGSFYNIYDRDWAPQCNRVEIDVLPCSGGGGSGGTVEQSASPAGVPAPTASVRMCQIKDGQVQHHETPCPTPEATAAPQGVSEQAPVSQSTEGQIEATEQASAAPQSVPVSQSNDGQIEATQQAAAAPQSVPVSESSEGQIEATSQATAAPQGISQAAPSAPVSQSSEGQIEATSQVSAAPQGVSQVAPVSQSSEGQIEATSQASAAPQSASQEAPVSQSSEGQIEATQQASAAPQGVETVPVSQISDGQIQATSQATAKPQSVSEATQTSSGEQKPEETKKPKPEQSKSEEAPGESRTDEARASAAPESAAQESVVQSNSGASTFGVNWGSRAATASVTPAWLGGNGGVVSGGQSIGGATERYRIGAGYSYALGILGMMFWVL